MELFGPNSWLTGMYLAALKAGAEMTEHLGDAAAAAEYRAIFSGFHFDMVRREISFRPVRLIDGCFRCFWSLDSGWGEFELTPTRAEVRLCSGRLDLTALRLPEEYTVRSVHVGAAAVAFTYAAGKLRLDEGVRLSVDAPLTVELLAPGA